jgi:hypothetical protein
MSTKKRVTSIFLMLLLLMSQIQVALAAGEYSLSNFTKTLSYTDNATFTDIGDSASTKPWYNGTIKNAYEYGLIAGVGNEKYDPSGNLTVAQAITIAGRIHSIYKYGTLNNFSGYTGETWYDGPVQYAKQEGLISSEFDSTLNNNISRSDMVYIWHEILQSKDLSELNQVISLPDVGTSSVAEIRIHTLYRAGILSGVDALGTFNPNTNITRAEAAAIFSRIVDVNQRKKDVTYPPETPKPTGETDPRIGTGEWGNGVLDIASKPNAENIPGGLAAPVDLSNFGDNDYNTNRNPGTERYGAMKESVAAALIESAFRTLRFELIGEEVYASWCIPEMPEGYLMGFEVGGTAYDANKYVGLGYFQPNMYEPGEIIPVPAFSGQYRVKLNVQKAAGESLTYKDIVEIGAAAEVSYNKKNYGATTRYGGNPIAMAWDSDIYSIAATSSNSEDIWHYSGIDSDYTSEELSEDCDDHWFDLFSPKPWEINPCSGSTITEW